MVVFAKTSSPQLYAAPSAGPGQLVWIAYYLPEPLPAQPPDTISLPDALAGQSGTTMLGGSFVFADTPGGLDIDNYAAAIVTGVTNALAQPSFPASRAFAWLTNIYAIANETISLLGLNQNGTAVGAQISIPLAPARFLFAMVNGVPISFDGESVVTFTAQSANALTFTGSNAPTQTQIKTATLPFTGDPAGTLGFAVAFMRQDLAALLGWGMQLLYSDEEGVHSQLYPLAMGDTPNGADMIGFDVQIDPCNVTNRPIPNPSGAPQPFPDRTLFAFDGTTGGAPGVTLASGYRTAWGDRIDLAPITASDQGQTPAGLVVTWGNPNMPGGPQFAMAPRGDFVLDVPAKEKTAQPLLCGLTPTETMTFTPKNKDRLRFLTGKPAFASGYPPVQSSTLGPPVDPNAVPMTEAFVTSWASVINPPADGASEINPPPDTAGIHYSAQPKGQPLFGLDDVVTPAAPGTLGPVDPGYILPRAPDFSVPLMPYGLAVPAGLPTGFDAAAVSGVEARIVAPVRRTAIGGPDATLTSVAAPHRRAALLADGATSMQVTTPMGLVATVDGNGRWQTVGLALNAEAGVRMSFCKPPPELQQALQSSELFLVIANGDHLGTQTGWDPAGSMKPPADPPRFFNAMTIADWRIEAQVGKNTAYGDYNDVMIVKGCRGSVADLVKRTSAWTQADTFSIPSYLPGGGASDPSDITVLSTWLDNYIQAAQARTDDPYFANFINIVQSPTWTGILVLKARLTELPKDLGGLLATINKDDSYAHHFGVTVSPVDAATVEVNKTSSMFELVNYVEPGYVDAVTTTDPMPPQNTPYDFQLLTMKALFENSAVAAFSSKAQLTLGQWFGDLVLRMGPTGNTYNTIFLTGSYQSQGGQTGYVLDCETSNQFFPDSTAITKIEVVKAQYVSIDDSTSRFDIWGFIDFTLIVGTDADGNETPFDIFSFGDPAGGDADRTGLNFAGLALGMLVDSSQVKTFAFDPGKMTFDLAHSTARPGSLYTDFALRPPALMLGTADADPLQRGFLTVATSGAVLTGVGAAGPWYGLSFGLDMGSIGALAGNAGLSATILTAWAPKSGPVAASIGDSYPVRLGLALPGVNPTAKLLSLEGVLRLAIGELSMSHAPVSTTTPATPGTDAANFWVLSLNDIALKFLGFLKIPPGGSIGFTCFGNPNAQAEPTALGWYAVYNQDPPQQDAMDAA